MLSFTSGAHEEMYRQGGIQNYPIDDFLIPYKQMATLCGLHWNGYVYSGGLSYASRHDDVELSKMREKAVNHACRLVQELEELG